MHEALKIRVDGVMERVGISDYTDIQRHLDWRNDYIPNHNGTELMTSIPIVNPEHFMAKGYKPNEVELSIFACDEARCCTPSHPINMTVSLICDVTFHRGAVIHGNVVVCGCDPRTGSDVDAPPWLEDCFPSLWHEPRIEVIPATFADEQLNWTNNT
jgi:hypothetical protein